ncbi:MAG: CRTAC1 family protein, partial [Thermoanaerobaculia bacterium]
DGTFTNIYDQTRFIPLGMMGSNHGDWNNDGYEDLLMGAGGPYFQQAEPFLFYENHGGDGSFTLITPFEMLSLWGKGHGSAFTDFDHDGFLDVATNNGGASPGDIWPSLVLRNKGNSNHWLRVKLTAEKPGTNALAVGARVTVVAGGLSQIKEIQAGGQFGAVNSLVLHFGLAGAETIDRLFVRWPNRELGMTVLENLAVDQSIEIFEGSDRYEMLWTRPVSDAGRVAAVRGSP